MGRIRFPKPRILSTFQQKTDYTRWTNPRSFHSDWDSRTQKAASYVPNGSRVIEFGAATRTLERFLDESCTYTPSDIVDRGPGTLVCDLNERPLPDLGTNSYDVAVIMGVLEYLSDAPAIVDWLAKYFPDVVVSYPCTDTKVRHVRGIFGSLGRMSGGWMNGYTESEFRALFEERGYKFLAEETWEYQHLFVFSKEKTAS